MRPLIIPLISLLLCVALTTSANADTVSVADSTHWAESSAVDTLVPAKRPGFFKRAYRFMDRCLSPARDTSYIDVQDYYNWCAMVQFTTRLEVYQMDAGAGNFILRLSSMPRNRIGPFFGWRFAFFGYNIDLKSVFINDDDTDLNGSIYSAAFGLDLFYRRVGGNFNIDKLVLKGDDMTDHFKGHPFDGVRLDMTRISFYYVPNYRHYSHQAAFSQTHRQKISAGSLVLGIQYAHNRCNVNWNTLSNLLHESHKDDFDGKALYGDQKNDELSFTGGYGYNWVFAKNWLLGSEVSGAVGYLFQQVKKVENKEGNIKEKIENAFRSNIALNASYRLALVYNCGPIYSGLQGVAFYYQHGNGAMMSRNFLASLYAFIGYNF